MLPLRASMPDVQWEQVCQVIQTQIQSDRVPEWTNHELHAFDIFKHLNTSNVIEPELVTTRPFFGVAPRPSPCLAQRYGRMRIHLERSYFLAVITKVGNF